MGGTCGAAVWAAAEVAIAHVDAAGGDEGEAPSLAERCRERRVIELGAGMGTLGLALALHGASHVTLTDVRCQLPLLQINADLNGFGITGGGGGGGGGGGKQRSGHNSSSTSKSKRRCMSDDAVPPGRCVVAVEELEWGSEWGMAIAPQDRSAGGGAASGGPGASSGDGSGGGAAAAAAAFGVCNCRGYDVVVGTDLVYDRDSFSPLLATMRRLAQCNNSSSGGGRAGAAAPLPFFLTLANRIERPDDAHPIPEPVQGPSVCGDSGAAASSSSSSSSNSSSSFESDSDCDARTSSLLTEFLELASQSGFEHEHTHEMVPRERLGTESDMALLVLWWRGCCSPRARESEPSTTSRPKAKEIGARR